MKKSILALMMAGVMVFGGSICTFAEEEAETEPQASVVVDYTMIDESVYDGTWLTFFDVFDLYLPSDWNVYEVTEEEEESGIYAKYGDEETGNACVISYVDTGAPDIMLQDIASALEFDNVEYWKINDIDCLAFGDNDDSTMGIAALGDQGGWYQVSIATGDPDDTAFANNIIYSFMATGTVEE